MKENREVTDTNVGDIEEAVKTMEHWVEYEKNNKAKINKADELINIQEIILSDYKRAVKENEEFRNFLEKIIREYIPDYELEQLIDRYKNESFIPRVEVKKILEDRRK